MKKILDIYIIILISIVFNIFAYKMLEGNYSSSIIISFWSVIIANGLLIGLLIRKKNAFFDAILVIFIMLFFIIAPVLQLSKGYFPIPFPIKAEYIMLANICNTIFIIAYCMFRYTSILNLREKHKKVREFKLSKSTMRIMKIIFFIYFIPNLPKLINGIMYSKRIDFDNQIEMLLINKCVLFIPLLFVFYYIIEYKEHKVEKDLIKLIFWIIILVICKNPFNEKRNALGPIYLSIILFMVVKKYNCKKFLLFMSIIFIVAFPLSASMTHSNLGIVDMIKDPFQYFRLSDIGEQFTQMHFDAFENLNVVIDYVKNHGFSMGEQLLGAVLFFIPRSIWINKPLSTGMLTGNYLISDYGFGFNNLSSPITAEAYINWGIIGIVFFAFIITKWSKLTYSWLEYKNYYSLMAWYMIIHLFFLLRGDLMNGIAYLVGPMVAIYFLPKFINKFNIKSYKK